MRKIILVISLLLLVLPSIVFADGVIFPPPDYWMHETDQKAVIFHEKNVETMVLSITFRGNAKDFSWIVPTPSRPEVEKSTDELFIALERLTEPKFGYGPMPLSQEMMKSDSSFRGVQVIETKKVEYYDLIVLSADDPEALVKWLKENGYQFPEEARYLLDDYIRNKWYFTAVKISAEGLEVAEEQLRQGHAVPLKFTFASSKIVYPLKISGIAQYLKWPEPRHWPESMLPGGETSMGENIGIEENTRRVSDLPTIAPAYCTSHDECAGLFCPQVVGGDTPCCIGGQCVCGPSDCRETGVMPPKPWPIWRPDVRILLYVFANHKKDLPGFNTEYANWIKSKEIEKLAIEGDGEPWVKTTARKYYLTKLSRYMSPSEMTYDLYLRDAEDNRPVGVKRVVAWQDVLIGVLIFFVALSIFLILGLISPGGLIFIICTFLQFFTKSKTIHIIAWIFQSLVLLITSCLGILWLVFRERLIIGEWYFYVPSSWHITYAKSIFAAGVTAWALFLLIMTGIMIWQIFHQFKRIKK